MTLSYRCSNCGTELATSNTGPLDVFVEQLRSALRACADDLEASVNAEYRGTLDYPSQKRKYDRDMEPVNRARNLLCSSSCSR